MQVWAFSASQENYFAPKWRSFKRKANERDTTIEKTCTIGIFVYFSVVERTEVLFIIDQVHVEDELHGIMGLCI